jgi:hypothetical protein
VGPPSKYWETFLKGKFDITPAELRAHRRGLAKRPSAVNDPEKAKQYDPEPWEISKSKVAALLPSNCPAYLLDDFVGFILGMRDARVDSAQMERSVPETLEDIRQKLLRLLPPWLDYLEANIPEVHELDGLGFGPLYRDEELLAEIDRLKRLLALAREHPRALPEQARVDPDRPNPEQLFLLFEDYRRAFPKSRNGRQTGISRDGPANRFIVAAIKLIGWKPMTPGAVEMMLRRAKRRDTERRPA